MCWRILHLLASLDVSNLIGHPLYLRQIESGWKLALRTAKRRSFANPTKCRQLSTLPACTCSRYTRTCAARTRIAVLFSRFLSLYLSLYSRSRYPSPFLDLSILTLDPDIPPPSLYHRLMTHRSVREFVCINGYDRRTKWFHGVSLW